MVEARTDLLISARTQGFERAQSDSRRLGRESAQATEAVGKEVKRLEEALEKLATQQTKVAAAMVSTADKASPAYKKLAGDLKQLQQEAGGVERTLRSMDRAFRESARQAEGAQRAQEARAGAFTQGLIQGVVPEAMFLQRGPGMARQAAGVSVGRAMRGIGRGMAQMPFTGAAGIAQALQSVPGGGFLAMPLMQTMAQAQQALQFREMAGQLRPFLETQMRVGGMIRGRTMEQQVAAAMEEATTRVFQMGPAELPMREAERRLLEREIERRGGQVIREGDITGAGRRGQRAAMRARLVAEVGGEEAFQRQVQVNAALMERARVAEEIVEERAVRERRARERTLMDAIRQTGAQVGVAAPQALQFAGAITQVGGGRGAELEQQQMLRAAFAAQRLFGVGPEVAGAFLQAGRRGGVVGAEARAGAAMTEALAGGVRMGLEGSELVEFMGQMAGDIRQWRQTGIPVNTGSITAMGAVFAQLGLGGVRGGVAAMGLTRRARELTMRGPMGPEELLMLQELGGFEGGGAEAFEEAQLRLERGEGLTQENLQRMMRRFMAAGRGGAGGRMVFRRAMRRLGVQVGVEETRLLEAQLMGRELTPEQQQRMQQIAAERERGQRAAGILEGGPEELFRAAVRETDPVIQRQVAITNQQLASGNAMIGVMQNLEKSTASVNQGFTNLAAGPLTALTGQVRELADEIPRVTTRLRQLMAGDVLATVTSGAEE